MADFNINPLVAQYLSGLGADLMKYGGNTSEGLQFTKLNEVTNQSIKSNSMMKLINSALGPDGSSVSADNKGLTIKATNDSKLFKSILGAEDGPGPFKTDQSLMPAAPAPVAETSAITPPAITNPFANIKPSDLAGMSPQEISTVLGMKQEQDKLKQQSYRDVVDALYKGRTATTAESTAAADIPYKAALTGKTKAETAELTPSVTMNLGGTDMLVSPKDAVALAKIKDDTTPADVKTYNLAVKQGYKGSILDYKNLDMTVHEKDFRAAKADGYTGKFNDWLQESIKNGAINLNEAVNRKTALDAVERQSKVLSPDFARTIESKTVNQKGWEFDNSTRIDSVIKKYPNLSRDKAIKAVQMSDVREGMDREIKQAYPDQPIEWNKDGWYIGKKRIVRDPYAK